MGNQELTNEEKNNFILNNGWVSHGIHNHYVKLDWYDDPSDTKNWYKALDLDQAYLYELNEKYKQAEILINEARGLIGSGRGISYTIDCNIDNWIEKYTKWQKK